MQQAYLLIKMEMLEDTGHINETFIDFCIVIASCYSEEHRNT